MEVDEPIDPKEIAKAFIKNLRETREWKIKCVLKNWKGFGKAAPFTIHVNNGVCTCWVFAKTKEEAYEKMKMELPVVKFLDDEDE
jgi:hypothetical protein